MNIDPLIEELRKPEYAAMSDQQAADAVNTKTVNIRTLVPNWLIKQTAILGSYWAAVKAGQASSDNVLAAICLSMVDWIEDPKIENTDMDIAGVQQMLAGLQTYGIISQAQLNELNALADSVVSWTSQNGLPEIGIGLVHNARKEL